MDSSLGERDGSVRMKLVRNSRKRITTRVKMGIATPVKANELKRRSETATVLVVGDLSVIS